MAVDNGFARSARGFFRDRAVIITGASSGIGYDLALAFARRGAQVALLARRKQLLEELCDRITATGGEALAIPCDVTVKDEVDRAVAEATQAFGQVDVLINSAGILIPDTVDKIRREDLQQMMDVNLYGTLNAIQAVLPAMREARAGSIVNIASLAGRRGISPLGGYSATKFAVVGLTEALRIELFRSGITVSLVMPGIIDTPMEHQARATDALRAFPRIFSMPTRWVTWAVMAAVVFRLAEVDVPPGAAVAEKLASLFPGITDAVLSVGTKLMTRTSTANGDERESESSNEHQGPTASIPRAVQDRGVR